MRSARMWSCSTESSLKTALSSIARQRAGKSSSREPPPEPFVRALRERGVSPIAVGRVIVATWKPHETTVLEVIRDLGLELHVTFNKDAVMVLPAGLSKATGLAEALRELGLSPHNVVGVGDGENDHAFLRLCECRIAVANAVPMLKDGGRLGDPARRRGRRSRAD